MQKIFIFLLFWAFFAILAPKNGTKKEQFMRITPYLFYAYARGYLTTTGEYFGTNDFITIQPIR